MGIQRTNCKSIPWNSPEIWEYYEAHKDELEDLDEYAGKRGLVKHVI